MHLLSSRVSTLARDKIVSSSLPCQSEAALLNEKIFTLHIMDELGAGSRGALERFDVLGEITNR